MLFDNPVFEGWYTDSMDVYRNVDVSSGNLDGKKRRLVQEKIPCRIYSVKKNGPRMRQTAAMTDSVDKLACDLSVEIKAGDELHVVRGGMLGVQGDPERYFADRPHPYYDPVGGVLSGLEHQEVALLTEEIIS
ncbi:MAG: hypothetical protein KHX84_19080 [Enterocloster asparagiformis]|jgi:hypothetical protein|nr:hypothetical protein [Enterocloster asparagiformis]DAL37796.1 MAG TPA_asm: hypothetical protein [Caudoviricetes sp.]